ncbi:hypothetical protein EVAR_50433_1 [Eumeta japonica]|uniref:Uncharacterized protein n=1 Tax=Eumeta variegata TaxID=151549 RepID=A0A4C1XSZ1_EUMVA|nr:hypothetical protein EVAR_50433_1 [Eumeta japonica]
MFHKYFLNKHAIAAPAHRYVVALTCEIVYSDARDDVADACHGVWRVWNSGREVLSCQALFTSSSRNAINKLSIKKKNAVVTDVAVCPDTRFAVGSRRKVQRCEVHYESVARALNTSAGEEKEGSGVREGKGSEGREKKKKADRQAVTMKLSLTASLSRYRVVELKCHRPRRARLAAAAARTCRSADWQQLDVTRRALARHSSPFELKPY